MVTKDITTVDTAEQISADAKILITQPETVGTQTVTRLKRADLADVKEAISPTVDEELSDESENPVQNKVIAEALDGKLDKSGGDMTIGATIHFGMATETEGGGTVDGLASPTVGHAAANKAYVDEGLDGKLDKTGGTVSGNIDMSNRTLNHVGWLNGALLTAQNAEIYENLNLGTVEVDIETGETIVYPGTITRLKAPTNDLDAANKSYVDAAVSPFDHETWTFTLSGGTTMTKEVVTWTSQT